MTPMRDSDDEICEDIYFDFLHPPPFGIGKIHHGDWLKQNIRYRTKRNK